MNRLLITLVGSFLLLSGCCNLAGGPSGGGSGLNSCLADCERTSVGETGLAGIRSCKAYCYTRDAEDRLDASGCDPINTVGNTSMLGENESFWFNGCVGDVAEGKKDVSICNKIAAGSGRDACIMNVFYLTRNPSDCDGLSDPRMKSSCQ